MEQNELNKKIELHFIYNKSRGTDGEKLDLRNANLRNANLWNANLRSANLWNADLSDANLSDANLWNANLWNADLGNANLPAPTMVLFANWGEVSDELCKFLMKYDASNHPYPGAFDVWQKSLICPYYNLNIQRAACFQEERELWDSSVELKSAYELMVMVLEEKTKGWNVD